MQKQVGLLHWGKSQAVLISWVAGASQSGLDWGRDQDHLAWGRGWELGSSWTARPGLYPPPGANLPLEPPSLCPPHPVLPSAHLLEMSSGYCLSPDSSTKPGHNTLDLIPGATQLKYLQWSQWLFPNLSCLQPLPSHHHCLPCIKAWIGTLFRAWTCLFSSMQTTTQPAAV